MLTALANGRPDRLPCQVHGWMQYYLDRYLGGADWYQANEMLGLDQAIYISPHYRYGDSDLANWRIRDIALGRDEDGDEHWEEFITTPRGTLHHAGERNVFTAWEVGPLIKTEADFEIWRRYRPIPIAADFAEIRRACDRLGDRGIVRSNPFSAGQGSPWRDIQGGIRRHPARPADVGRGWMSSCMQETDNDDEVMRPLGPDVLMRRSRPQTSRTFYGR